MTQPSTTTRRNVADALRRLSRSAVDSAAFRREAVTLLGRAVAFDAWCWALIDPASGLPSDALAENPVVSRAVDRFMQLIYGPGDAPMGVAPGMSTGAVHSLLQATGGDLARSARWREILGPGGYGDELVAGLVAGGLPWGHLSLYRDTGGPSFSAEDRRFVSELAPVLAGRLREAARELMLPAEASCCNDPGTLLIGPDLSLLGATPPALRWLDELAPTFPPNKGLLLPPVIYALCAQLDSERHASARVHVRSRRWWFVLTASVPSLARSIPRRHSGVTIRPANSTEVAELQMLAWGLSARERQVARLLMDGGRTEEIGTCLGITDHTVRDHVRSMFHKTGAQSRRDLVAALVGQEGQRGRRPGPGRSGA